jgi:hypothetical protein
VYDVRTKGPVKTIICMGEGQDMKINNGRLVGHSRGDGAVIADFGTGKVIHKIQPHSQHATIYGLALHGNCLATCQYGDNNGIYYFDLSTREPIGCPADEVF